MKEEWFPLVNEKGETIGKATRKECHNGSKNVTSGSAPTYFQ